MRLEQVSRYHQRQERQDSERGKRQLREISVHVVLPVSGPGTRHDRPCPVPFVFRVFRRPSVKRTFNYSNPNYHLSDTKKREV